MRQTLIFIPHEVAGVPVMGFGWLLALWAVFTVALMGYLLWRQGWNRDTQSYLPVLLVMGAAVAFLLPNLETVQDDVVLGLPIRGYGVMLLLALVSSLGVCIWLARRAGIAAETIVSLATWMAIPGIAGSRLFFVIQYWERFQKPTVGATIVEIFNFTNGGLVVYGAVIGAFGAGAGYLLMRRLSPLAVTDVIAPGLMVGLAVGRIGCLLNGCCWGGECESSLAIRFPAGSPAYVDQLKDGRLLGLSIEPAAGSADSGNEPATADGKVVAVQADGAAETKGIQPGDIVRGIDAPPDYQLRQAGRSDAPPGPVVRALIGGRTIRWSLPELPRWSRPLHPAQIYSSINALLLSLLLAAYAPFRRRVGEVTALMITIYPITRFLLEMIRSDESGQFGTGLTISQWVSLAVVAASSLLWWYVLTRSPLAQHESQQEFDAHSVARPDAA